MKRPWMPLYVADYLADTAHLRALQSGAYLHLIMHYWRTGGLPNDDAQLAAIARLTDDEWHDNKTMLQAFFTDGWKHKRIDSELSEAEKIQRSNSEKARGAAKARWDHAPSNAPSNAASISQAMPQNAHFTLHTSQKKEIKGNGVKEKSWTPPRHGATSTAKGRVYVLKGTAEWASYEADFRAVHGVDPEPNAHGGKWFKTLGEADAR